MSNDEILMARLICEINSYGFEVQSYEELKSVKRKIKNTIPVLLKYLYLFNGSSYTDAILRLLSVKGFNDATEELLEVYNNKNSKIDKWVVGDALYSIQDKRYEDEYINIIDEKSNGTSRQMITILLGKIRCEKAISHLISLLQDEDVNGHAIIALGYFRNNELIKYIEPFLDHEKRWVRKEAEKAIKKITS